MTEMEKDHGPEHHEVPDRCTSVERVESTERFEGIGRIGSNSLDDCAAGSGIHPTRARRTRIRRLG
jgi:hypothetical protein